MPSATFTYVYVDQMGWVCVWGRWVGARGFVLLLPIGALPPACKQTNFSVYIKHCSPQIVSSGSFCPPIVESIVMLFLLSLSEKLFVRSNFEARAYETAESKMYVNSCENAECINILYVCAWLTRVSDVQILLFINKRVYASRKWLPTVCWNITLGNYLRNFKGYDPSIWINKEL